MVCHVVGRGQAPPLEPGHALLHQLPELGGRDDPAPPKLNAHWDVTHQLVDQREDQRPGAVEREVRAHEPHAAVDVVAHAARTAGSVG